MDAHHITPSRVLKELAYTIIISAVIAAFLTFTGITTKSFIINLVVSLSFGVSMYSSIHFLLWVFKPRRMVSLAFIVIIGIASGTVIGLQIGSFALQQFFSITLMQQQKSLFRAIVLAITFSSIISYLFYSRFRLRASEEVIQQERIKVFPVRKKPLRPI